MRLTREDLLFQYPSWNESKHDIVKAMYGDIAFEKQEESCKEYRTFIGSVCVDNEDKFLYGDINVKCKGKTYGIRAYAKAGFEITSNRRSSYHSFMTKDYPFSMPVCSHYEYIDKETVEKVINEKLSDYGVGIQKIMEFVRAAYVQNGVYNYTEQKLNEYYKCQPKPISSTITNKTYTETKNALEKSLNNYLEYGNEYGEKKSLMKVASLVANNIDEISTKVLEMFIFPIKTFNYPSTVREWLYDFRHFCVGNEKILSLIDQNNKLKNYVHFDASEKKPKTLGDFK